ncbi:MAG: hypothetical protein KGP35_05055 [Bacteroidetes bacterium]|nr:hypothetical protein [Bacteroidota bacterium]
MRKVSFILFAGILLIGCKKSDNGTGNANVTVIPPATHSCGAKDVHNPALTYGTMTDQEENLYKTIKIGDQTWMAENLKTTKYRNGTAILNITDSTQWANNTTGAYASYDNKFTNDCPYGKLYNWFAVANSNQLCPTGWHVPTDAEWATLINFLDANAGGGINTNTGGVQMKSTGTKYWEGPDTTATNSSGWSGLPGGYRFDDGSFYGLGLIAPWWSATEKDTNEAWYRYVYFNGGVAYSQKINKTYGLSVRCIKD